MMLRVQDAGTHRTAQSRVLVLDAVLTQQAGVVPLPAGSCSTLDAYSAVLRSKRSLLMNMTKLKPFRPNAVQKRCSCFTELARLVMEWEMSMKPSQAHSEHAYFYRT